MALPSNNGIFIHEGLNCSPVVVPTAQSIPLSPSDSTSVKTELDNKSDLSNIADTYDPTDTYAKDACVIYEGVLYQCINSSGTTGTWVPADWTAVKAVDVGSGGGGGPTSADQVSYDNTDSGLSATDVQDAIDEVVEDKADSVPLPADYDATSTYTRGDLAVYNDVIYVCKSTISTPEAWDDTHWLNLNTTYDTDYLHSINPTGIGTFSLNRKASTAIGLYSFAEGYDPTAIGFSSHAEGYSTTASAVGSHAEGYFAEATGSSGAHAEGNFTTASGNNSHAEGQDTTASGDASHAEGYHTNASGKSSHAEGTYTAANHKSQHVFGEYNVLDDSTAQSTAKGNYIEIVGNGTSTSARSNARTLDWNGNEVLSGSITATDGNIVNSLGTNTIILSGSTGNITCNNINGEDITDKADRVPEPAEYDSTATYNVGDYCIYNNTYYCCISAISTPESWTPAHWSGLPTPQQDYLHSIDPVGIGTLSMNRASGSTIGLNSVAVGYNGTASGTDSHAEGGSTTASGDESHAEGLTTTASGYASHAEGHSTRASDTAAHAEGRGTTASGKYSHAEGQNAYATGNSSHAEGMLTTASGAQSHAEGNGTMASGYYSHSEGLNTIANHESQHVFGEHNIADTSTASASSRGNYIEIVGNGTDVNSRSNARTLDWSGNEILAGGLKINSTQDVATQVSLTQAEYDALVSAGTVDLVNTIYFITDADAIATSATEVSYSNTISGMVATNVQSAIDELYTSKMNVTDPTGTGSFSLNREANTTVGSNSVAMGNSCTASGDSSYAEGNYSTASGRTSHAEGDANYASGEASHAEGQRTVASGVAAHTEGWSTLASGPDSHAEGSLTTASGAYAHAEGSYTTANHSSQHVFGEYNIADPSTASIYDRGNYVEIVGNGTSTSARSNARTLDWSGNEVLAGGLTTSGNIVAKDSNGTTKVTIDNSNGNIACSTINSKTPVYVGATGVQEFINQAYFNMGFTGSLNNAPTYGVSFVSGTGLSNSPSSGYVFCISVSQNGNKAYVNQLAFVLGNQSLYVRSCNNGNWSTWRTI